MPIALSCLQCRTELRLIAPEPGVPVICPGCGLSWLPTVEELRQVAPEPAPPRPRPRSRPPRETEEFVTLERAEPEELDTVSSSPVAAILVAGLLLLVLGGGATAWFVLNRDARQPPHVEAVPADSPTTASTPTTESTTALTGEQIYRRLLRSTVFIVVADTSGTDITFIGCGSGALIHKDRRLVVTNYHVVGERARVAVFFPALDTKSELITKPLHYITNAKTLRIWGRVVARDPQRDLALLELETLPSTAAAVSIASRPAATNSMVWSIGASGVGREFTGALWRGCTGSVTNRYKDRLTMDNGQVVEAMLLQTQKPVNPGDSGGPTVNDRCELVGVVSSLTQNKNLVTHDIDETEIRSFLAAYAKSTGWTWEDGATGSDIPLEEPLDVATLIARLKDPAADVRLDAVQRLGSLGVEARDAYPKLIALLDEPDDRVRRAVLVALGKVGPPKVTDAGCLEVALREGGPNSRLFALRYFAEPGRSLPIANVANAIAALSDASADLRLAALQSLTQYGVGSKTKAFASVLECSADENILVANAANELLELYGPPSENERDALVQLLSHEKASLRLRAVRLLAADSPACKAKALTALIERIGDDDRTIAAEAAKVVADFAPFSDSERKILAEKLSDKRPALRLAAVQLLDSEATDFATAIKWFRPLLTDDTPAVQVQAITCITRWGPAAAEVRQHMITLSRSGNAEVAIAAIRGLALMGNSVGVMTALEARITDPTAAVAVKDAAAEAILSLDLKHADTDIPAILRLTILANPKIRKAAITKIAGFGKDAVQFLEPITAHLKDSDVGVRLATLQTIAAIGKNAAPAIPDVAALLTTTQPDEVAIAAANTLSKLGPKAIEPLAEALSDKLPDKVLEEICDSLGSFGKEAQSATPAIFAALAKHESLGKRATEASAVVKDQQAFAPDAVSRALIKIGGDEMVKKLKEFGQWTKLQNRKVCKFGEPVQFWAIVVIGSVEPDTLSESGKKLVAEFLEYEAQTDPDPLCRAAAITGQGLHPLKKR